MNQKTIRVLFLAAEADPLVKVGGLGDVAGSLPRALNNLPGDLTDGYKIDSRLVLPFHSMIRKKVPEPQHALDVNVHTRSGPIEANIFLTEINGLKIYLINGEPIPANAPVYSPEATIDGPKYIFFSLAAIELAKVLDWKPDIIHANDWHTSLAVYALDQDKRTSAILHKVHSILTIHNLPFMGNGTEAAFDEFELEPSRNPNLPWWARKRPLPLGLQTADRIVAVSPTYANEIMTPEYGCGLESFLIGRAESISGIVNGLDQESWDPTIDGSIYKNFSVETLPVRAANKKALVKELNLDPDPSLPLLILISRMDPQKGVDLAVDGLRGTVDRPWQAILLGTGDPKLENACLQLQKDFPDRIRAVIRFDSVLSRRMYAGADVLLMPSRYEPCGLAQMMAMRYGCIPLARSTGGLQDTIENNVTGFMFEQANAAAFQSALVRALDHFSDQEKWQEMQKKGMSQDFSWQRSAIDYAKIYRSLVNQKS